MDDYETNVFQQPYILLRIINILFGRFKNLFWYNYCSEQLKFSYPYQDIFKLNENVDVVINNEIIIKKVKLIISMNYRITNSFWFHLIIQREQLDIPVNNYLHKRLMITS
jgi:hypothetical protein